MLFQLNQQDFPDARQSSVIPEEYAGIALSDHIAHVTVTNSCTLIHQTIYKKDYSLWINNFFIHEPLLLFMLPQDKIYSLYYNIENTVVLVIKDEQKIIPPKEFDVLELPPGYHHCGAFDPGVYRSLHLTVNEQNKFILEDQDYATALLREYYFNAAASPIRY